MKSVFRRLWLKLAVPRKPISIYPGYLINGVPFEFSERTLITLKDASNGQVNGPWLWTPDLTTEQQKQLLLKWCEDMGYNTDKIRDLEYTRRAV